MGDVRGCLTGQGYTFKKLTADTAFGFFGALPTHGAYEANSADGAVSVEYAFGNDAKEAKNIAQKANDLSAALDKAIGTSHSKDDYKIAITSSVVYWWTGADKDTVRGCLSRAENPSRSTPVATKTALCKKPGIRYVGKSAEGVKVCFTLSPDGTKLIQSGWIFAGDSGSGCSGIPKGAVPGTTRMSGDESAATSGRHFEAGFLKGTIRDAKGSLLSTASGVLSDSVNCPGKTFKWTAHGAP